MSKYMFAPKLIIGNHSKTRLFFGLCEEMQHHEHLDRGWPFDDVELLIAALVSDSTDYRFTRSQDSLILMVSDGNIRGITGVVRQKIDKINTILSEIGAHGFYDCNAGVLTTGNIQSHYNQIRMTSNDCFNKLFLLDEKTDTYIGQVFRRHINFEPDEDLVRAYHFFGNHRSLVIPNAGGYRRIQLPEGLCCSRSKCNVGEINRIVIEFNNLVSRIDWECLQIAHKMMDHQETNIPNGPYWVI